MSVLRVRPGLRVMVSGAALAAVTAVLGLTLIGMRSDGPLIPWLAQTAVDAVDRHPNSAALLLSLYQSGLARLEGNMALFPAFRLFNTVVIMPEVRAQLLYSLQFTLETVFRRYLPEALTGWIILEALLPALAAEAGLRSRNRRSDLPPLSEWFLPRAHLTAVALLLLTGFLPYLTGEPLLTTFSCMASSLGFWAVAAQGASMLIHTLTNRGLQPFVCAVIIALGTALLPQVLFFLGAYDQFRDPRGLRGPRDEIR